MEADGTTASAASHKLIERENMIHLVRIVNEMPRVTNLSEADGTTASAASHEEHFLQLIPTIIKMAKILGIPVPEVQSNRMEAEHDATASLVLMLIISPFSLDHIRSNPFAPVL